MRKNTTVMRLVCAVIAVAVLGACAKPVERAATVKQTIRIGVLGGYATFEENIRSYYTEIFENKYPNAKVEIVGALDKFAIETAQKPIDRIGAMLQLLTSDNPPDVVVIEDLSTLPEYIQANALVSIEPYLANDNIDLNAFIPNVVNAIKSTADDGKLYGLTPMFSSYALFYNKKIFEEAGIAVPTDNMTWDQVLALGTQLNKGKGKDAQIGFAFNYGNSTILLQDATVYTRSLGMRFYDEEATRMTINTPEWQEVFSTLIDWKKKQPNLAVNADLFKLGKLAMVIQPFQYVAEMVAFNEAVQRAEKGKPIDWDVVTVPTHESGSAGLELFVGGLMAINAKAQNMDGAWDFIRFILSPEWIKLKSRSIYGISSLSEFAKPKEGVQYNLPAFYKVPFYVSPSQEALVRTYPTINDVIAIGQPRLEEVAKGKKTLKKALAEWETSGNKLIKKIRELKEQQDVQSKEEQ